MSDAGKLAIRSMSKTMDSTSLTYDKLEFATLSMKNGKLHFALMPVAEIEALLEIAKAEKAAEDEKNKEAM